MTNAYRTSWARRRGLTLVEVLAGTALLGTLLVSILLADGRCRRQSKAAEDRVAACRIADELLESWWAESDHPWKAGSGKVDGHDGWRWRTRQVERELPEALDCEVLAVDVIAPGEERAAVTVELLVRKESDAATD